MKVLLSIKPEFADKIFEGIKRYEYRRSIFKRDDVKRVVVYATAPVSKIIGEFEVGKILHDDLQRLWSDTEKFSGISKDYFLEYFSEKDKGYAIQIKSYTRYENPICIKDKYGVMPPQSFIYVS